MVSSALEVAKPRPVFGFSKRRSASSAGARGRLIVDCGVVEVVVVVEEVGFDIDEKAPGAAALLEVASDVDFEEDRAKEGYFARIEVRKVACFAEAREIRL